MTTSTAVVTGAGSGIGAALARALRPRVERLVLVDIHLERLSAIARELDAVTAEVDVSDPTAVDSVVDLAGAPDYLCLNAGILSSGLGAPWEVPSGEWERVMAVNLGGVVNGLRAFVPPMLSRAAPCSILITGSLAGLLAWPGGGPYAASKHAVTAVAEQAALALDATNISVTLLCPALVKTAMSDIGDSAEDVARLAIDAMDAHRFVVAPPEWSGAIVRRAEQMISEGRPNVPTM